jgi:uncharacterized protein
MTQDPGVEVLPEHACWMQLRSTEVGRLAVCADSSPDIFPINFLVDHGTVVFRTAQGSKLSAALSTPVVAFEADGYDKDAKEAWSVVVRGHVEEVVQLHERIDIVDLPLFPWHGGAKPIFLRLVPETISGRRFHVVDTAAWDTPTRGVRRASPE